MEEIQIRLATESDISSIQELYRAVATTGGLARKETEITFEYIAEFVGKSLKSGLILVACAPENVSQIIGELHGYRLGPEIFAHVLENVTMAVHPEYQGKGIGRSLLQHFQSEISQHHRHFLKIELKCFSTNEKALNLYQKYGFKVEGRQEKRVQLAPGLFADGLALAWFNPNYRLK